MWPGTTKGCQVSKQCFRKVKFGRWNILEILRSKHEILQTCDVQNVKCLRNVTFKIWEVSETWCSKHEIFQKLATKHNKRVLSVQQCFRKRNVIFLKHFIFSMSHFWNFHWNISHFGTLHFWNISCLERQISETFYFWNVTFWNISCFERHVSETFHVLNFTSLKHFIMFRTLCFWNIVWTLHTFLLCPVTFDVQNPKWKRKIECYKTTILCP